MKVTGKIDAPGSFEADEVIALVSRLLESEGVPSEAAMLTASSLVASDLSGLASHGVMLLPMYLQRLAEGSVSPVAVGEVLRKQGGSILFDAQHGLGQVTSRTAVDLAIAASVEHGVGAVSVRNGFHFGEAGAWAAAMAREDAIGLALCNTRPLMPAPGGAEPVVGNNPLSIAVPCAGEAPIVLDLALSEAAMGKIRNAASAGQDIPLGWATDRHGVPTSNPADAIAGMLLPAGGAKGFGLAVMVDLLCGALSGGGTGGAVNPLYGDSSIPYGCSHFFLALRIDRFRPIEEFTDSVAAMANSVRSSRRAPGVDRVMMPGDPARASLARSGGRCVLPPATVDALRRVAAERAVDPAPLLH